MRLRLKTAFVFHNSTALFVEKSTSEPLSTSERDDAALGFVRHPRDRRDWPLVMSSPERAILEVLDEVPQKETFHQADVLIDGLRNLSPRRLRSLLVRCRSIKVKRLFLWFAERHEHVWLKSLSREGIDLGRGKRMLVRGGKLDPKFNITVPENIDAIQ
jgi:hypothetical protein